MNLLTKISSLFPSLTRSEKKVAQYILANPNDIEKLSIQELAKKAQVGESTILRFTRKIGMEGYQEFKIELVKNQLKDLPHSTTELEGDIGTVYDQLLESLNDTSQILVDQKKIMNLIAKKISDAECVYLFAVGNSGTIAEELSNRLTRIGKKAIFHSDTHIQAIYASVMTEQDVGFAITVSGNTKDVITNVSLAQKSGSKIIALTNYLDSGITKITEDVVVCSPKEYASLYGSFSAKVSQMFTLDVLIRKIVDLDKENIEILRDKTNTVLIDRLD